MFWTVVPSSMMNSTRLGLYSVQTSRIPDLPLAMEMIRVTTLFSSEATSQDVIAATNSLGLRTFRWRAFQTWGRVRTGSAPGGLMGAVTERLTVGDIVKSCSVGLRCLVEEKGYGSTMRRKTANKGKSDGGWCPLGHQTYSIPSTKLAVVSGRITSSTRDRFGEKCLLRDCADASRIKTLHNHASLPHPTHPTHPSIQTNRSITHRHSIMTNHPKQKAPLKKKQPIAIGNDSDNDLAEQTPRAFLSRGAISTSKAVALASDSESDDETNNLLSLLAPRSAPRSASVTAFIPTPVQRPLFHPTPVAAPGPAPAARTPKGRASRPIPGQPKPFPGFGKRVAVDNHFLLSIIHYDPFPVSEQDNLDGTMARKWDNCLSTIQEEDPKTFGAMTPQLCYTSWLVFRDEYEKRILSGDYWGAHSDEEQEFGLSRRALELKNERLHLLQNCYMMEVQAICKESPSWRREVDQMTPGRKKVFCKEAGLVQMPRPRQTGGGKGGRRGNAERYAPY